MYNNLKENIFLVGFGMSSKVDKQTGVITEMLTIHYDIFKPKDDKRIGGVPKVCYSNNFKNIEILEKHCMQTVKAELKPMDTDRGVNYKLISVNDIPLK